MMNLTGIKKIFNKTTIAVVLTTVMTAASTLALAAFADDPQQRQPATTEVTVEQIKTSYVNIAYSAYLDSYTTAQTLQKRDRKSVV